MEFLDSLDFELKKKPNRVRSWYLYEQFKSLENNQLEAAKKLKNKCYQERILRKELSEHKARRSLYGQSDTSCTDGLNASSVKSTHTRTSLDTSNDDFLESYYQLEDEQDHDGQSEIELSHDDFQTEHPSSEFKSVADPDNSIASVIENLKDSENITDEIKEELEFVKHGIAENITLQLEAAKENVHCLEKFSDFCEIDKFSGRESVQSNTEEEEIKAITVSKESHSDSLYDNSLIVAWMKLVNFAYQVIKLNHGGNCYSDYSSQFLTAVLACDVLRRGINRMCDILQPYICPIKYYDDETKSTSTSCLKKVKRKSNNMQKLNFEPSPLQHIKQVRKKPKCTQCRNRKYNSENFSNECTEKGNFKNRISSEPLRSVAIKSAGEYSDKTRSTNWPSELSEHSTRHCTCPCCVKFKKNPMLKVTEYIDGVLAHLNRS